MKSLTTYPRKKRNSEGESSSDSISDDSGSESIPDATLEDEDPEIMALQSVTLEPE